MWAIGEEMCDFIKGMLIGNNDLWIEAHALSQNVILVSNNVKEFSRIPTLKLENWVNAA